MRKSHLFGPKPKKRRFIRTPSDKIGSFEATPLSDAKMTSSKAEERAKKQLDAAKWRRDERSKGGSR